MLHTATILLFATLGTGAGALLLVMLRNERHAILRALFMTAPDARRAMRSVRVTQVRYAARLRHRQDRAPAYRAAA